MSIQLSGSLELRAVSLFSLAAESQLMDVICWDVIWEEREKAKGSSQEKENNTRNNRDY